MPSSARTAPALPDAAPKNWLDRFAPGWLVPYGRLARWDRPIGWWLLLLPCWWSSALAAGAAGLPFPSVAHLALFMVGAIVMRGAGCTYNDLVDRDIDAGVARTRNRPLPSGAVAPLQARLFIGVQSFIGLAVLLQFNRYTIALGIASLAVVAIYPFMKRITDWPQFVLGLAFSWGALVGWSAIAGRLAAPPLALYAAAVAWTVAYDTIYAHQDQRDDAILGVRSTARFFGSRTKPAISGFFAAATALAGIALVSAGAGLAAYAGLAAMSAHFVWQVATLDPDDPANCLARFRSNRNTGLLFFAGLVADVIVRGAA